MMQKFMRSIYDDIHLDKRAKRQLNLRKSRLTLSDNLHSIISLVNQNNQSDYYFDYSSSLDNLTRIELVFPIRYLTTFSSIHLKSKEFNLVFRQPFQMEDNFVKIDLTKYIRRFPLAFSVRFHRISLQSSGFMTLFFRQSDTFHSRTRRQLSSLFDDHPLITHPHDLSSCQVRSFRTNFSELNWTSWIIEPSSYEMNFCSGTCHSNSGMPSYFTMQDILHRRTPQIVPTLCCKPKRFAPTILLYYDGLNLVLKRQDNMRVVECGCS